MRSRRRPPDVCRTAFRRESRSRQGLEGRGRASDVGRDGPQRALRDRAHAPRPARAHRAPAQPAARRTTDPRQLRAAADVGRGANATILAIARAELRAPMHVRRRPFGHAGHGRRARPHDRPARGRAADLLVGRRGMTPAGAGDPARSSPGVGGVWRKHETGAASRPTSLEQQLIAELAIRERNTSGRFEPGLQATTLRQQGFRDAGGGTRTPDTRIMIPLL